MHLVKIGNVPDCQLIEIYRGSDLVIPFLVSNSDGTPRDITSDDISAQMKRTRLGTSIAATFTVIKNNATAGQFYLLVSGAMSLIIPCGEKPFQGASRYWWDVKLASTSGPVANAVLRYGEAVVYAQVTGAAQSITWDGGGPGGFSGDSLDGGGI